MQKRWVFGLSIDDELACGLALVDPARGNLKRREYSDLKFLKIADLSNGPDGFPKVPLRDLIHLGISQARKLPKFDQHWDEVEAVGISSIGIVDRHNLRLVDIRRKPWAWERTDEFVLDFKGIIQEFFPRVLESGRRPAVAVHNDATAKCMTLCYHLGGMDEVICLVMAGIGVNVGVATLRTGPPFTPDLHTEMGHAFPRLHPIDTRDRSARKLRENPGCPTHVFCFEGLASGHRMETFWPKPFRELKGDMRREAKEVISYYLAQLCWSATLAVSPSRILISRSPLADEILPDIRNNFMRLNNGEGRDRPYLTEKIYAPFRNGAEEFIQVAPEFGNMRDSDLVDPTGLLGAIELGRWAYIQRNLPAVLVS